MDIERTDIGTHRRRQRRIAQALAGLAFLSVLALAVWWAARPPQLESQTIWRGKVTQGEFVREVVAPGTIAAPEIRAITNSSEGVVERIRLLPGTPVAPDTVILDMRSPQLEEDLGKARLDLAAAEAGQALSEMDLENRYRDLDAELAQAQADYTSSRIELEAKERVPGIVSALDLERMRLRTAQLKRRLDAEQGRYDGFARFRKAQRAVTQSKLISLRQEVDHLAARAEELHVRAGVAGVVQEVNVQAGERLAPGQALARVVNPSRLIARLSVSEREAALVRTGLEATLQVGEDRLRGQITRVDPTVRDHVVTVDVELTRKDVTSLRPDLSVMGRIELERVKDALIVDRPAAVRGEFETVDLFVIEPGGSTARRVPVKVGRASARQIEILQGLHAGDEIILSQLAGLQDESVIRIR